MTTMTASEARRKFFGLLDSVAESHVPVLITSKRHNGVLVSEEDWQAIQETLYLCQIPGMAASIREGMATPASEMSEDAGW